MISEEAYEEARLQKEEAEAVIGQYFREKDKLANERWWRLDEGEFYTDDELLYAATSRCKCGAGLAYPQSCPSVALQWTCSRVLTGRLDNEVLNGERELPQGEKHDAYPFHSYEVKSEDQPSANGQSTRNRIDPEDDEAAGAAS